MVDGSAVAAPIAHKILNFAFENNVLEFKSIINLNWIYVFILFVIFWIGEINLYSAAGGSLDPWASNQLIRFLFFSTFIFFSNNVGAKIYFNFAEIFLILVLIGLIITLIFGYTGMGY